MLIETVVLHAADLDALYLFYGERLGLPVVWDGARERLTVTGGASRLVFQHEAGFAGSYHFAFNLPENRLTAARAWLAARGIAFIADGHGETLFTFDSWDAHALYFYDAAGNIAECIARHELPNALPDADHLPFSSAEFLNISEIGLPTASVPVLANLLSEHLKISPYRDASPEFIPLGDASGLFILVPEGRIWFPDTGIAAEALPVQAVIRTETGARFAVEGVPYRVTAP